MTVWLSVCVAFVFYLHTYSADLTWKSR
jgi:hypothetical protein